MLLVGVVATKKMSYTRGGVFVFVFVFVIQKLTDTIERWGPKVQKASDGRLLPKK